MNRPLSALALCLAAMFSQAVSPAETPSRNPVLLLHGIKDDARKMEPMARYLRGQNWDAEAMSFRPSWGQSGLEELALQVSRFIDASFDPHRKIDIVAFSMGGLVARYYLQRLGGLDRVDRFITLSTPHHGTLLAHLIPNAGCRQMRPDSAFLRDLNGDADRLAKLQFTSFWTPFDLIILPPRSSMMPQARNIRLPIALHPLMVLQSSALGQVAAALEAPATTPAAAAAPATR